MPLQVRWQQCHHQMTTGGSGQPPTSPTSLSVVSFTMHSHKMRTSLPTSSTTRHCMPSVELSPTTYYHPSFSGASTSLSFSPSNSWWVWPFNFYMRKMDPGFKWCRIKLNRQHPVEKVFQDCPHTKFIKSTFYNHHHHWMTISLSVCEQYTGYGHTECGRWSTFLCQEIKGELVCSTFLLCLFVLSLNLEWSCFTCHLFTRILKAQHSNSIEMVLYKHTHS